MLQIYVITKLLPKFQYTSLKIVFPHLRHCFVGPLFTPVSIYASYQLKLIATDIENCLFLLQLASFLEFPSLNLSSLRRIKFLKGPIYLY
jgi:hypothetical protein